MNHFTHPHLLPRLFACVFALIALVGVAARLLPAQLQSLPYVPVLVALTPWLVIPAVLALVLALASKRWVLAAVSLACIIAVLWWELPFFHPSAALSHEAQQAVAARTPDTTDRYARLMTLNVFKGGADVDQIVQLVRDQRVEVLALQETTDDFVEQLQQAGIGAYLPYSRVSSADGSFGNGLWSATPLGNPRNDEVNSVASMMPAGSVDFDGGATSVRFVSVHTTAPVAGYWSNWRRSLEEVAGLKANTNTRYVLMGDFNATLDHAPMRAIVDARFTDAAEQAGHGFTFTWPRHIHWVPAFAGIDHIILDEGMTAGQMQVVTVAGTDHAALLATVDFG